MGRGSWLSQPCQRGVRDEESSHAESFSSYHSAAVRFLSIFFLKLEGKHLRQRIILFRISELSLFKHFIILGLACSHSEALRSAEEGFRLSPKRP